MLTEKPKGHAATDPHTEAHGSPASIDDLITYFQGEYVPMRDARVSVLTHAFMYGTAVFEGIRAYWNEEQGVLYGLKLREHMERIRRNAGMLLMTDLPPVDELVRIVVETVRRNHFQTDVYVRPCFYKSGRSIGVKLHNLPHDFVVAALPFGNYIDTEAGVRLMTSSWRRNADGYVNMAFQKSEAELNGYDEALVLTADGHASEASAANMFVVRDGVLLTPPVNDDILEGVTRKAILELAGTFGIPTEHRSIDRSEIYVADEMFLCGTGVQLSPVVELDHRPIGGGAVGPITRQLSEAYFAAVRGKDSRFAHWLTPIPSR